MSKGILTPFVCLSRFLGLQSSDVANILSQAAADVYVYIWRQDVYPTIMGNYENHRWLVMFSLNGVMETAFPPTDPEAYLADSRFHYMGTIQELLA
jgi:hypothetical protein